MVIRVKQVAKALGIPSKELIKRADEEGVFLGNHMDEVGEFEMKVLEDIFGKKIIIEKPKKPVKKTKKKKVKTKAKTKDKPKDKTKEKKPKKTTKTKAKTKDKPKDKTKEKKPKKTTKTKVNKKEEIKKKQEDVIENKLKGKKEPPKKDNAKTASSKDDLLKPKSSKKKKQGKQIEIISKGKEDVKLLYEQKEEKQGKATNDTNSSVKNLKENSTPNKKDLVIDKIVPSYKSRMKDFQPDGFKVSRFRKVPLKPAKISRKNRKNKSQGKVKSGSTALHSPIVEDKSNKFTVPIPITMKDFSKLTGTKINDIMKAMMKNGKMMTINDVLDEETLIYLAIELSLELQFDKELDKEELFIKQVEEVDELSSENIKPRPPIVTFMGHVDHGKTSLLDKIRESNVVSKESGGITQHIGAYQVICKNNKKVTFLDTPGHEAFTKMRARGANVTDIVVLVVAADDGVMPQTEEAINHTKAAGVPILVAVNKIDKPNASPKKVKHQLSLLGLIPEDWGGNTVFVEVSAITGEGIDELVEMLSLEADMLELQANPDLPAKGTVVEAKMREGRGNVANIIIQNGTLKIGDVAVCGRAFGKIRAIYDYKGDNINQAFAGDPVEIIGLAPLPQAGDKFNVMKTIQLARQIATERDKRLRMLENMKKHHVTLENLFSDIEAGKIKEVNVILKADVNGSVEVITQQLLNLKTNEVAVKVVHSTVGNVNESDIILAEASNAIILCFDVGADEKIKNLADSKGIDIRYYDVIYELIDEIKAALEGLLEPDIVEEKTGELEVRNLFKVSSLGQIAGCFVTEGKIIRNSKVKLVREKEIIYEGKLDSLKRFKDDAKEVLQGFECGVKLDGFNKIQVGDVIQAFIIKKIARRLDI